jgi:hypothetical protein
MVPGGQKTPGDLIRGSWDPGGVTDDPKPPVLLCALIALGAILASAAVLLLRTDDSERRLTAAVSAAPEDLSQLIRLQRIYSNPPQEEDPSKYPKLPSADHGKRSPAKNAQ